MMAEEVIGLLFGVEGIGVDGASGKEIVAGLTRIVNEINGGKSSVPKIKFEFDTSEAHKAIDGLKAKLKDIEKIASIKVTQRDSGKQNQQSGDSTKDIQKQIEKYRELSAVIKKWVSDSKTAAKLSAEYSGVSRSSDGSLAGTASGWSETISQINATAEAMRQLRVVFDDEGKPVQPEPEEFKEIARAIGITEEQYKQLFSQVQSGSQTVAQNVQNVHRSTQNAWDKQVRNVSQQIDQMYDVISKDPRIKKMADDLRKYMQSGSGNVGDLKNRFDELSRAASESGANIETWGDKFKRTFAGKVRSALAGAITAAFTKYLREVYQNVIQIDKVMTDLQIASGKTREEIRELTEEYSKLAKEIGATTVEVAKSADTWLRQGYAAHEANTLIKNSMMLSKLGQIESAEAAKNLTSAMKGYKVEVEDSIRIVDKFTAVDMVAAASAGDIATAMAETATSANIAGVSMDRLIGYLAIVKEVTQDGAESVGTFYKTLFARMNNVKAGKFVDDESGEALNDVEKTLGELGIALRDANGLFRDSGNVLDEVGRRWEEFDNVQQHAIATAMAGTRQQEKFIVLMENYGTALGYAETAAKSAGTAVGKFGAYTESIEGKFNSLKASFEEFSLTFVNSKLITGTAEILTWLLEALTWIIDKIGGLNTVLYATVAIIAILKADAIVSFIMSIGAAVVNLISFIGSLIASIIVAKAEGVTMGQLMRNAFHQITAGASTAQIAVAAFVAVISILLIAVNAVKRAQDKAIQTSLSSADAYLAEAEAAKKDKDSLEDLIDKYEELAEKNNGVWDDKTVETVKGIQDEIVDLVGDQALALDLVNGKLETELSILKDIAGESNKVTLAAAQSALADAKSAIQNAMNKWEWGGDNQYYDIGTGGLKSYGGIKTETVTRSSFAGAGSLKYDTIKVKFDTAEEFAAQYEAVQEYKNKIAGTIDETNTTELFFYEELNEYLATYKDVYNTYASARDLVNELTAPPDTSTEGATNQVKGLTVALKSAYDILEEVQGGYDGLANALADVTDEGYLTADALSTLFKLESDNALAGLKLEDILIRDANGYKLAEGALQKYVQALVAQYTITEAFATLQDKENAIANLKTLQAVLATLAQTQEDSTEADKRRREALEKQQDAYNDQLDAYRELIDIRKDLLQTYEEELSYQKELARRQRNVTALQTKLSVARLDQSAAGQARVRELEAELKEAQDDLEDFTLEHAIDVLSNQLESQYAEYEGFIKSRLDEITNLLEALDATPEVNINTDTGWVKDALNQIETLIKDTEGKDIVGGAASGTTGGGGGSVWKSYQDAANAGYSNIRTKSEFARGGSDKEKYGTYDKYLEAMYNKYVGGDSSTTTTTPKAKTDAEKIAEKIVKFGNASGSGMNAGKTGDNGVISWNGKEYEVENKSSYGAETNLWKAAVEVLGFSDRQIFGYDGYVYGYLDGKIQQLGGRRWSQKGYHNFVNDIKAQYGTYHTGGLVGDIATLSSSEEFAKLLKGEFVSTPAQMKRFMEETLPKIANYPVTGGSNEFNAPLIEILCESVTTETLPELERIVNEAVKEIKRQLDSGMSRTGLKRPATKRLT